MTQAKGIMFNFILFYLRHDVKVIIHISTFHATLSN